MEEYTNNWFKMIDDGKGTIRRVSKFKEKEFIASIKDVASGWPNWTPEERLQFAGAFALSRRANLDDNDLQLLHFLVQNGEPRIWQMLALPVVWNLDRNVALDFLLARVKDGQGILANYYQALAKLSAPECVPDLMVALSKHRAEIDQHPVLESWDDRFVYLDYLACSAALYRITEEDEYRTNLMLEHSDESIRKMTRTIASTSGIAIE